MCKTNKKGGVIFSSYDGVAWDEEGAEPAYGFKVEFDDGKELLLQRRERPMLLNDGNKRYATEVIADEVNFCGDNRSGAANQSDSMDQGFVANTQQAPAAGFTPIDTDDDLPF